MQKTTIECDYKHDPDNPVDIGGDCDTCIHEKNRTCPFGIYDDTVISFPDKNGEFSDTPIPEPEG